MDEYCDRHHGAQASGRCHACGKPFCRDCLSEGLEHQYCAGEECQAMRARYDAMIAERNDWVEEQLQKALKVFNARVLASLALTWVLVTPVFVYLGSDRWTANWALASAMGPLGALVLCLQLNALVGIYRRKYLERLRGEMISGWGQREVEAR